MFDSEKPKYSTYARTLIVFMSSVLAAFVQKLSSTENKDLAAIINSLNQKEIDEALCNAPSLLKSIFKSLAKFAKKSKGIHSHQDMIHNMLKDHLIELDKAIDISASGDVSKAPTEEFEEFLKATNELNSQLADLEASSPHFNDHFNDLIAQHIKIWEKNQKTCNEKAIAILEKALPITFSEYEKAELLDIKSSKSRQSLLSELSDNPSFLSKFSKKDMANMDIFALKVYATLANHEKQIDAKIEIFKDAKKVITATVKEKRDEEKNIAASLQKNYKIIDAELIKFAKSVSNLLGLVSTEDKKRKPLLMPILAQKPLSLAISKNPQKSEPSQS